MLKILMMIALSLNIAFAKSRFTDADKLKFMEEVKQGIAAHKIENKGNVDLQIIKPGLYEELDIYYKQEKFTREEMVRMKQNYEAFSKNPSFPPSKAEEEFYKFVQKELDEINKTQVVKIKEGFSCNNWSCEDGLKCAPDPRQEDGKSCKKEGRECKDDGDCCSSSCTLDKKSNKRFCEEVYRCFKPLSLGQACSVNPVCGEGECLAFNSKTSGIGECEEKGRSCKKNSDCCSNSCNANKCVEAYICKDCVKNGKKPDRGQKCCEGLYLNGQGLCVPDAPPFVIPQVNIKSKIINLVASLFISNAHAEDAPAPETKEEEAARLAKEIATTVGAKSSSPEDISKALETYNESKDDLEKLKKLAALDVKYQDIYDQALEKEAAEDAKEAARLKQVELDNSNMTSVVLGNQDKYSSFRAESAAADKVQVKTPEMKFTRKSDFNTCDIRFRDDFANYLKTSKLIDLELALLSFDYMMLGDGVNDYWTKSSDPGSSIYGRLKTVARKHQLIRTDTNKKIDTINHKLTCMCLDVKGYKNITNEAKKSFFEKECSEYSKYADPSVSFDELEGDASGVKGKRLLVSWTKNLESFNASLAIDNTAAYKGFAEVANWSSSDAKWNEAENKKYTLFNFNIKNPSGSVAAMGAILGALLAAGVIAILGGFASTSILTAWAAAGIIATSAVTGGTGLWLIASLKGAWVTKRPEIFDKYIRSYGCGKKETCVEYSRELNQPYNNICKVHTSANACVKNFVVYYEDGEARYLVDPWIPKDVSKSLILRDLNDGRDYAQKLEDGFQAAKSHMIAKNPGASGGGGKDGGAFVGEDYMRTLFVDSNVLGQYVPKIGLDDKRYIIDSKIVEEIKAKAKKYAIEERFFQEGDTENLNKFADYTYQYHFIWPKTSRQKEISYPTVGLTTYLDLMSNGVAANMAVGATNAAKTFGNLNTKHLEDYLNTLNLYRDQPINQSDSKRMALLNAEIAKVEGELKDQRAFSALANNTGLDSQLLNLNAGVNSANKLNGGNGNINLTSEQAGLLNAIGTLRVARKEQLKKLETYTKAVAKNGNPERAAKVASASKTFAAKFANPLSGSRSGGSLFGSGGLDGLGNTNKTEGDDKNKDGSGSKNGQFGGSFGNTYGSGSGGSHSSTSSSSGSGKSSGSENTEGTGDGAGAGGNGVSEEDRRRLAEAVEARDRASKEKYQSKEEQTIFEKVTNAYIRNYDKVLSKKKDKDVVEQK